VSPYCVEEDLHVPLPQPGFYIVQGAAQSPARAGRHLLGGLHAVQQGPVAIRQCFPDVGCPGLNVPADSFKVDAIYAVGPGSYCWLRRRLFALSAPVHTRRTLFILLPRNLLPDILLPRLAPHSMDDCSLATHSLDVCPCTLAASSYLAYTLPQPLLTAHFNVSETLPRGGLAGRRRAVPDGVHQRGGAVQVHRIGIHIKSACGLSA